MSHGEASAVRHTNTLPWFDNHCHLESEVRPGQEQLAASELLADARGAGVVGFVDVAVDLKSSRRCLAVARAEPDVWATVGVHPHSATEGFGGIEDLARSELSSGALVAIGECGLDYHYDHSPREVQRAVFEEHIGLATALDLPLVIHTREAWEDTFAILESLGVPRRVVFHCFTGGPAEAERAVAMGALLSISGIVTFGSAGELRDAVRCAPLDHLMVETDTPYLAPVPHRGRPNRPALVAAVGERVAEVKDLTVAEVSAGTVATTERFYGVRARRQPGHPQSQP